MPKEYHFVPFFLQTEGKFRRGFWGDSGQKYYFLMTFEVFSILLTKCKYPNIIQQLFLWPLW